jgi:hypothetical protein
MAPRSTSYVIAYEEDAYAQSERVAAVQNAVLLSPVRLPALTEAPGAARCDATEQQCSPIVFINCVASRLLLAMGQHGSQLQQQQELQHVAPDIHQHYIQSTSGVCWMPMQRASSTYISMANFGLAAEQL